MKIVGYLFKNFWGSLFKLMCGRRLDCIRLQLMLNDLEGFFLKCSKFLQYDLGHIEDNQARNHVEKIERNWLISDNHSLKIVTHKIYVILKKNFDYKIHKSCSFLYI